MAETGFGKCIGEIYEIEGPIHCRWRSVGRLQVRRRSQDAAGRAAPRVRAGKGLTL